MSEWSDEQRHNMMVDAFIQADSAFRNRIHETWHTFGGHTVRMRIVGDRLARCLVLPFAHLRCRESDPSGAKLTIDLWDLLETGIAADIDVAPDPLSPASRFSTSEDERFVTSVLQHSITSFDRRQEHIVGVALGADRLSLYERGRPLHVPLSLWYNDRDIPLIHAALVSYNGDGILLAGPSGAGKTTSSLSCMTAGFQYLADDLAGLEILADGASRGHSVYGSAFVDGRALNHVPTLREHAIAGRFSQEEKRLVLLSQAGSTGLMSNTRIRLVALVRLAEGNRTRVRPATKGESLLAMIRSALQTGVLSPGRRGFELLGCLSDNVSSFWLEVGPDSRDVPRLLRALLRDSGDPSEWRSR